MHLIISARNFFCYHLIIAAGYLKNEYKCLVNIKQYWDQITN